MLTSTAQHVDTVIDTRTFFFSIIFHYVLSQDIEYNYLCYIVELVVYTFYV